MIKIREEQKEELARAIENRYKQEFSIRLREDFPNPTAPMSPQRLSELVEQGWVNANELEITEKEEIYRFLKLQFLPEEMLKSAFVQSVLIRVLNNLNLSGVQRLDFIERQLAERDLPKT